MGVQGTSSRFPSRPPDRRLSSGGSISEIFKPSPGFPFFSLRAALSKEPSPTPPGEEIFCDGES